MKRAEYSLGLILIVIALAVLLFSTPLFGKIQNAGDQTLFLSGLKKTCGSTGQTLGYYEKQIGDLYATYQKNKKATEDEQQSMKQLCSDLNTCFPGEYFRYELNCNLVSNNCRTKNDIISELRIKARQTEDTYFKSPIDPYTVRKLYEEYRLCYSEEVPQDLLYTAANAYFSELSCQTSWGDTKTRTYLSSYDKEAQRLYSLIPSKIPAMEYNLRMANIHGMERDWSASAVSGQYKEPEFMTYVKNLINYNLPAAEKGKLSQFLSETTMPLDFAWEHPELFSFTVELRSKLQTCDRNYYSSPYGKRGGFSGQTQKKSDYEETAAFMDECCSTTSEYSCIKALQLNDAYTKNYGYDALVEEFDIKTRMCYAKVLFVLQNYQAANTMLESAADADRLNNEGRNAGNIDNIKKDMDSKLAKMGKEGYGISTEEAQKKRNDCYLAGGSCAAKDECPSGKSISGQSCGNSAVVCCERSECEQGSLECMDGNACPSGYIDENKACYNNQICCRKRIEVTW